MKARNATPLKARSSALLCLPRVYCLLLAVSAAPVSAQDSLDHWILATPLPIVALQVMGVAGALGALGLCCYLWLVPEKDNPRVADLTSDTLARNVLELPISQPSESESRKKAA